ncbi:Transcription initiation factor TFIID subunit 5 [Neopestalotiopsis sp. 37M]|nr:Transcription initiation factor TFIID subunit 5 [Neopestalotiopsis sp. 37M]
MSNAGAPSTSAGQTGSTFTPVPPPPTPGVAAPATSTTTTTTAPPSNQNLNQIPRPDAPMPPSQRAKAVDVDYILKMASSIGRGEKMVDLMTGLNKMRYANDNQVTDYLIKRGYTRTEEAFRKEIAGGPTKSEEDENKRLKPDKYVAAFEHLFELGKVLWPVFVYSYLDLVKFEYKLRAESFMLQYKERFENVRADEVNSLKLVKTPKQLEENPVARLYLRNKYRIPLNKFSTGNLFNFLERDSEECGNIVTYILGTFCDVESIERGPIEPFSFEAIYRRARNLELDEVDAQEGIPGIPAAGAVTLNKEILENGNNAALKLGLLPMEPELRGDVLAELEDEDKQNPPADGSRSLVDEFNLMHPIKKEAGDSPQRTDIPYPPSRARDIVMEIQKVRENRDRFKIEGRTGGVGPAVTVCMYTFHNSLQSYSCMDFSKDQKLVAVGTTESYIRVWTLDGSPLKSQLPNEQNLKVNNRKLIGHSGPVYSVAFSDATKNLDRNIFEDGPKVDTDAKLLISCSYDGTIRLWSLETWTCLCVYKGHYGPIMKLAWGPHGHYFATGGWDKTVRIWSQDRVSYVRLMVGHDTPISALCWHPNGAYVFSASDEADKTIRMWSVSSGNCVRIFTGHTDYISTMETSPNGKILATADTGGNIMLWDIAKGERIKRMRGHGRNGVWSISFNVESNTLVSGGADMTVRVWDIEMPAEGTRTAAQAEGADGAVVASGSGAGTDNKATATNAQGATSGTSTTGTGKKKGKEVMITPDQISCFPTKRTTVHKVMFTRMNLVMAGGCYEPEQR